jgi:hypothetical protein
MRDPDRPLEGSRRRGEAVPQSELAINGSTHLPILRIRADQIESRLVDIGQSNRRSAIDRAHWSRTLTRGDVANRTVA